MALRFSNFPKTKKSGENGKKVMANRLTFFQKA
jgi:hypothetical protein